MSSELESTSVDETQEWSMPGTAAEKIANTLRELSQPDEGAEEMELMLATIAMGLERGLAEGLEEQQRSGKLDEFVLSLTRFLALHRSDDAKQLIVVEMPARELPAGTRLHLLDEAAKAAKTASSPL
jgi:hypothetical protein